MTVKELNIVEALRNVAQKILVPELEKIKDELSEIKGVLNEHSQILKEHSQILKEHSEELKEIRIEQGKIQAKLDIDHRVTRIETVLEAKGELPPLGGTARERKTRYRA